MCETSPGSAFTVWQPFGTTPNQGFRIRTASLGRTDDHALQLSLHSQQRLTRLQEGSDMLRWGCKSTEEGQPRDAQTDDQELQALPIQFSGGVPSLPDMGNSGGAAWLPRPPAAPDLDYFPHALPRLLSDSRQSLSHLNDAWVCLPEMKLKAIPEMMGRLTTENPDQGYAAFGQNCDSPMCPFASKAVPGWCCC